MPQGSLFPDQPPKNDDFLYRQLIRLGDMIGDGLHHESDGRWIEKEYTKIAKLLHPEAFKNAAKIRIQNTNKQVLEFLTKNTSPCCSVVLIQSRSGSKVCFCLKCNKRYKIKSKKK